MGAAQHLNRSNYARNSAMHESTSSIVHFYYLLSHYVGSILLVHVAYV